MIEFGHSGNEPVDELTLGWFPKVLLFTLMRSIGYCHSPEL